MINCGTRLCHCLVERPSHITEEILLRKPWATKPHFPLNSPTISRKQESHCLPPQKHHHSLVNNWFCWRARKHRGLKTASQQTPLLGLARLFCLRVPKPESQKGAVCCSTATSCWAYFLHCHHFTQENKYTLLSFFTSKWVGNETASSLKCSGAPYWRIRERWLQNNFPLAQERYANIVRTHVHFHTL